MNKRRRSQIGIGDAPPLPPMFRRLTVLCPVDSDLQHLKALRLADVEGLSQVEAAGMMGILRRTFIRIPGQGRKPVSIGKTMGWAVAADIGHARMVIDDFWGVVFNPSSMDRLSHSLVAAWSAGAFLVISVAAYYLIKKRHTVFAASSLKFGLVLALTASMLSLVTGHGSAVGVAENQPSKLATMEGLWETGPRAPLHPFGWVDTKDSRTAGPEIPAGLRLLVSGRADHVITGLNDIPPDLRPPVQATFQFFHIMEAVANLPREVHRGRDGSAFVSSCATMLLMALFGLGMFPNMVYSAPNPAHSLTAYNAASTGRTLKIMTTIAVIGLPIVLTYTATDYYIFRGKVKLGKDSY